MANLSTGTLEETIEFTETRQDCSECPDSDSDSDSDRCVCTDWSEEKNGFQRGWREAGPLGRKITNWPGPDATWLQVFKGNATIYGNGMLAA